MIMTRNQQKMCTVVFIFQKRAARKASTAQHDVKASVTEPFWQEAGRVGCVPETSAAVGGCTKLTSRWQGPDVRESVPDLDLFDRRLGSLLGSHRRKTGTKA